jgi:catechol 2,3-dioxygenase-like lactoylglutathione lyase family enzyme
MSKTFVMAAGTAVLLAAAQPARAQLLVAKDGPVVYGHHHLAVSSLGEAKKFFVTALGGTDVTSGTSTAAVVKFPNVFVFFQPRQPTGGTKGTTVNHIGFSTPDLPALLAKVKANGFRAVTREETAPTQEVKDDIAYIASLERNVAFVMGPDDLKVELVELKNQKIPIALHHVHFFGQQNEEMAAWYAKVFGAAPGVSPAGFPTANLPGVALNFTKATDATVGTRGRALDHVGFEVKDLEAFCKKLESMGIIPSVPYRKVPALGIAIAFITDPWGTYIELTEGLDKVS